jgi:hypothetical protein
VAVSALTVEREHSQFPEVFLGYVARFLVLAEADELGMSQPVRRPFQEFNLSDGLQRHSVSSARQ